MVTPVLRNPQAYMRDPRAGQRNVQLEAQAVLDQAKPMQAAFDGLLKIGEVFAKADLDEQVASATLNFKHKGDASVSALKDMPLAKTYTEEDLLTGAVVTKYDPTHSKSFESFQTRLMADRQAIADTLPFAARSTFLSGTASYTASLLTEAAAVNQKQHIEYLKGKALLAFNELDSLADVDEFANQSWVQAVLSGQTIADQVKKRKELLSVDHYGNRIVSVADEDPGAIDQLKEIKKELNDGVISDFVTQDGTLVSGVVSDFWSQLESKQKIDLMAKIDSKIDGLNKMYKQNRQDFVDELYVRITRDATQFNEDSFTEMLQDKRIDSGQYKDAVALWREASSDGGPKISDAATLLSYEDNLSSVTRTEIIGESALTIDDRRALLEKKRKLERDLLQWDSASNPVSNKGNLAVKMLAEFYGISPEGSVSFIKSAEQLKKEKEYFRVRYQEMEEAITNNPDIPPEQKPAAALKFVQDHINRMLSSQSTPAAAQEKASSDAIQAAQIIAKVDPGNIGKTLEEFIDLPESATKKRTIEELKKAGIVIPSRKTPVPDTPDDATLIEENLYDMWTTSP